MLRILTQQVEYLPCSDSQRDIGCTKTFAAENIVHDWTSWTAVGSSLCVWILHYPIVHHNCASQRKSFAHHQPVCSFSWQLLSTVASTPLSSFLFPHPHRKRELTEAKDEMGAAQKLSTVVAAWPCAAVESNSLRTTKFSSLVQWQYILDPARSSFTSAIQELTGRQALLCWIMVSLGLAGRDTCTCSCLFGFVVLLLFTQHPFPHKTRVSEIVDHYQQEKHINHAEVGHPFLASHSMEAHTIRVWYDLSVSRYVYVILSLCW